MLVSRIKTASCFQCASELGLRDMNLHTSLFWKKYKYIGLLSTIFYTFRIRERLFGSWCSHFRCQITQHKTVHNQSPCWMHWCTLFQEIQISPLSHVVYMTKTHPRAFQNTVKQLRCERLGDKRLLDLINFTRRRAMLVVPDLGSHYCADQKSVVFQATKL